MSVATGDYIVGDADGVAVIPRDLIETVLAEAEALVGSVPTLDDDVIQLIPQKIFDHSLVARLDLKKIRQRAQFGVDGAMATFLRTDCIGATGLARSRDGRRSATPDFGPSVNQLVLVNRSKRPLLLLAGELVSGGKQDRIIAYLASLDRPGPRPKAALVTLNPR